MIDLKKIAEKIREIASFYAPDDGCTNAIYDAQIAIANELDPPAKPFLADAKVGDWVEYKGNQYRISAFGGGEMMFFENAIFALTPPYPIRKLASSEVRVKIGCLEGTVRCYDKFAFCLIGKDGARSVISFAMLDSDTAALVRALPEAQEEI